MSGMSLIGREFYPVSIEFAQQKVYIRAVLTHAEYDREGWKNDSWYN